MSLVDGLSNLYDKLNKEGIKQHHYPYGRLHRIFFQAPLSSLFKHTKKHPLKVFLFCLFFGVVHISKPFRAEWIVYVLDSHLKHVEGGGVCRFELKL